MNPFRCFWLASSGFRTYRFFLELPFQTVLKYWFLFAAFLAVILLGNFVKQFKRGFPLIVKSASYIPPFKISKGQAYSSLPQPYFANTNQFPIILDLENKLKTPENMFPQGILILQDKFKVWLEHSELLTIPWLGWPDGEVNIDYLKNLEHKTYLALPWIYFIIWLTTVLLGLLQALLFTLFTSFIERSASLSFKFNQLLNLAVFAITPSAMILTIYLTIDFYRLPLSLLYFTTYCFFFIMATSSCRELLNSPKNKAFPFT